MGRGGLRDGSFPYAFLWMWVRQDFFRILFEDFYVFNWVRLHCYLRGYSSNPKTVTEYSSRVNEPIHLRLRVEMK